MALLYEVIQERNAVRLTARHQVIEHARIGRLIIGAARHPHVNSVPFAHEAVHVHAVSGNAEIGRRCPLDQHERLASPAKPDRVAFVAPAFDDAAFGQPAQRFLDGGRPCFRRIQPRGEHDRIVSDVEQFWKRRKLVKERVLQPADFAPGHDERPEMPHVARIAFPDAVEKTHGIFAFARSTTSRLKAKRSKASECLHAHLTTVQLESGSNASMSRASAFVLGPRSFS